jgi:hypothetical protein
MPAVCGRSLQFATGDHKEARNVSESWIGHPARYRP